MKKSFLDTIESIIPKANYVQLHKYEQIIFQIHFIETDKPFLCVVDSKGVPLQDIDFRFFSDPERTILKSFEEIKQRYASEIIWGNNIQNSIPLYENPYILFLMKKCTNIIDSDMQFISFSEEKGKLELTITGEENLTASLKMMVNNQPVELKKSSKLLSDSYMLNDNKIFEIFPLNGNPSNLKHFLTKLNRDELPQYLSILLTHFPDIKVNYKDYKIVKHEPVSLNPAIFIDSVDDDSSMCLRVSAGLGEKYTDLYDRFKVNSVASVYDDDKKITVRDLLYCNVQQSIDEISKKLTLSQRKIKQQDQSKYILEDNIFIIEENLAKEFLSLELHSLLTSYSIYGTSKLKKFKLTYAKPSLNIQTLLSSGINFLEGEVTLNIEGDTFSIFDAVSQYKANSYIKLSDGTKAIMNPSYIDKLKRLFKSQESKSKFSFFDLPLVEELIDNKINDQFFLSSKKILEGFNSIKSNKFTPNNINAELRPYQTDGCKWLSYLHKHSLGGCLADDMGLGKTLQAISLLATVYPQEKKPSLIVMPKSLLFNWANELKRFVPHISFYTYYATDTNLDTAFLHNIILTTYGKLRSDITSLKKRNFYYVILDESQNIKNVNSQTSKAAVLLNSEHKLALSGTPIENNLTELYSLFRFINPTMFGSFQDFNSYYTVPIQKYGDSEASHELKRKIYPFILRRLKKDVLKDLPDKVEQTIYVEMSDKQKMLYEERRKFYYDIVNKKIVSDGIEKTQFVILQALMELRQIASIPESKSDNRVYSPKREILIDKINDAILNDHKILVFTNFLAGIDKISEDLESRSIEYVTMTGATKNRQQIVETFQKNDNCKVLLATLKTGSLGLNLTAADMVFLFDPWWNNSAENQAIDRAHRIGQDKTVFSYKLISSGSIEEKILMLQERKRELFDELISSDTATLKSLTQDDVKFILG